MNNIYDNGEIIIGKAKDILQYQAKHQCDLDEQDYKDIKEDLERYLKCDENIIVAINYDNGMGYTIDYWDTKDIVKE